MMEHITSPDGTQIGFVHSGSGMPLVLVHGTTADHRRWASITPQFEQYFNVYTMDRRGRGGSGDMPDYDILREAEDVAGMVEAAYQQVGEPVSLLGHSFGALCSLEAALLTDKLAGLILYEPPFPKIAPLISPDLPRRLQALIDRGDLEAGLELFMRKVVKMPDHELAAYRQLPMWKFRIQFTPTIPRELAIAQTYRFEAEKYAKLQVPTALLLGGDSPHFARQAVEIIAAAVPGSRLIVLPGQQHIAMDTNPELFVGKVVDFLLKEERFSNCSAKVCPAR